MAAHYTEAQDAVILDGWALVPTAEIARQLGKSPNSVTRRALRGLRLPQLTSGRRWTDREDRWVTFHWGVDPPGVIASDLGRTLEAVQARARYRSLALGPWSRGTVSLRQMAVLVGWDRRAVRRALRAMHVPIRLVGRRSHIDELQAQKIGKWLADHPRSGWSRVPPGFRSVSGAAKELGVPQSTLRDLIRSMGEVMAMERCGMALAMSGAQFRVLKKRVEGRRKGPGISPPSRPASTTTQPAAPRHAQPTNAGTRRPGATPAPGPRRGPCGRS